jgi:hypothetical protein
MGKENRTSVPAFVKCALAGHPGWEQQHPKGENRCYLQNGLLYNDRGSGDPMFFKAAAACQKSPLDIHRP